MEANVRSSIDIFIRKAFIHSRQRDINLPSSTTKPMRSCYWTPSILPKTVLRSKMRCVFPELRFSDTTSCCIDLIQYAWENKTRIRLWITPLLARISGVVKTAPAPDGLCRFAYVKYDAAAPSLTNRYKILSSKKFDRYLFPFAMSLIVLNPVSTAMSLQFSSIYYIVLLSMLIILKKHEYFYQKNLYPYLFFGLGIITVYFDFLIYPLAALCTPLILVLILEYKISLPSWTSTIRQTLILGICFGLGYVSMWFGKWAISSILLHENIIANAISEFTVHTGQTVIEGEAITKFGAIFRNLRVLLKWPYFIILGGYALYSLLKIDWRKAVHAFANIIPFLCVSLVPFAWIFVTSSHASWCYWYTYRGFIASIFGFLCGIKNASAKELYQSAK